MSAEIRRPETVIITAIGWAAVLLPGVVATVIIWRALWKSVNYLWGRD